MKPDCWDLCGGGGPIIHSLGDQWSLLLFMVGGEGGIVTVVWGRDDGSCRLSSTVVMVVPVVEEVCRWEGEMGLKTSSTSCVIRSASWVSLLPNFLILFTTSSHHSKFELWLTQWVLFMSKTKQTFPFFTWRTQIRQVLPNQMEKQGVEGWHATQSTSRYPSMGLTRLI